MIIKDIKNPLNEKLYKFILFKDLINKRKLMIFSHPRNVCMTYFSHFKLSMGLSFLFFKGSLAAFIHSFYPDICVTSSSSINQQINQILTENGCRGKDKIN